MIKDFEEEELNVWSDSSLRYYVWQLFTGETTLDKFEEDILSFRNSEYYKGNNEMYKIIKED